MPRRLRPPVNQDLFTRGGIITEIDPDFCIVRLRMPAGMITPERMKGLGEIAKKYGIENIHLTTRQTVELPHVDPSKLEPLLDDLAANGTPLGAEREEVVNVTSCLGTRHCKFGIIDSVGLAEEIDKKFFGKELPIKVRIAISSCPNGCESERLNEIGITGIQRPIRDPGLCTGCGTCTHYCREKAIEVQDGVIVLHAGKCMECGFCIKPCPFHIIQGSPPEYRITVGGHRGRHPKIGRHLIDVKTPEEVIRVVDKVIYWIYRQASTGSLLPEQLDELEFDEFKKTIVKMIEG
ncbi:4Fe-4S binding protein [Methanoregula formicica]|uniref:Dissimilatory sulfite reductase (Desulfoviridin), alpha/beta subunit n=1 Tax=Methanoregula formicica (strain DSM 22288 / NBRC 105244 / SMSP) TaxID=593750 RepID=L0HF78_METFS|nr:4Fe-4S dicluster domain-containing protein [Methanoregula formicica]AGB01729.1 dissimilatory sulfite reductase (desulfoviridin), alpha/beta subunit [Methanoregula formicica SMSP]